MTKVKNKKFKVLCAMSGGVDSSVATALLVRSGYDVTGAFMVNFESDNAIVGENCWRGDYQDALRVSAKIGIPLLRFDFRREYKKFVLDYMYREYKAGRTPNPDVLCNKFIKFGVWLDKAKKLGFDYLATGHYARLDASRLICAKDNNKDQTYFLHQLNQAQLKSIIFPIGEYTKSKVREFAKKFDLPTAGKEESMGICFVGEVPMKKFLMKTIKPKKGIITSTQGEVLGEHDGLAFYTIGERVGIACHSRPNRESNHDSIVADPCFCGDGKNNRPFFVVGKNTRKNELIVGFENDPMLYSSDTEIKNINWISGREPKFPLKCEVRLRHRQPLQKCVINKNRVLFAQPQRAVTPGQFAVFYLKGVCLGGGEIK